jgi:quercetin dioxygenase-like cupin family protein
MAEIVQRQRNDRSWSPVGARRIERWVVRENGRGGATYYLKFAAGAAAPAHNQPEGEELYVVSGDITVGGRRLKAGDYLYTPPNEPHDAVAHEETVLLLSLPMLPVF